jgi:IS4 transposase
VFYQFLNSPLIDWRKLLCQITGQLIRRVEKHSDVTEEKPVRCLIADDTDLPKRGKCFELLSRIYSHVTNSFNYGFKGLFLGYHDGKSFFGLDFSLHGEKGNEKKPNYKPYGLTKKQLKKRFKSPRSKKSCAQQRVNEYFKTKTEMLIEMIRSAVADGYRFDYLLTDSWFTNIELIRFIVSQRIKCHFLGMVKNIKTGYLFNGNIRTFSGILKVLKHSQKAIYCKRLRCKFYEVQVELQGIKIKLFFCKTTQKGKWCGLLTTNTDLGFEKAFEIYATRWTIEVFFKECKQLLRLGKCESRHFEAQIATTTLCMLQYNLLSVVKRFEGYESLGILFRQANADMVELTVRERIILIIKEILIEFSENMHLGIDFFLEHIFAENEQITKMINLKTLINVT